MHSSSMLSKLLFFAFLTFAMASPRPRSYGLSQRATLPPGTTLMGAEEALALIGSQEARRDLREVYLTVSLYANDKVKTADGTKLGAHITLHFNQAEIGEAKPARLEIVNYDPDSISRVTPPGMSENALVMTTNSDGIKPPPVGQVQTGDTFTRTYSLGKTKISNSNLYRFASAFTARFQDISTSSTTGVGRTVSNMNIFLLQFLNQKTRIVIPSEVTRYLERSHQYERAKFPDRNIFRGYQHPGLDALPRWYNVKNSRIETIKIAGSTPTDPISRFAAIDHLNPVTPAYKTSAKWFGLKDPKTVFRTVFADQPWHDKYPLTQKCSSSSKLRKRQSCVPPDTTVSKSIPADAPSQIRTTRYRGEKSVSVAWKSLGRVDPVLGPAGVAAGPVFLILDIVHGDTKSAIIQAVAFAVDVALLLATESVPVIGILAAAVLAFLPDIFGGGPKLGRSGNATEIVQFSFFGDRTKTGNERCNDDRKKNGQSQDCIVLYGPGHIAKVFQWEIFDAVAFVAQFNEGYQMSIPDIADAFTVDDTITALDGKIAAIECPPPNGVVPLTENDAQIPTWDCDPKKIKYRIQRDLIKFPELGNTTATAVHDRIITGTTDNKGDCKILIDPLDNAPIPFYNFSTIGDPSGFACNVTAAPLTYINSRNLSYQEPSYSFSNASDVSILDLDALFSGMNATSTGQNSSQPDLVDSSGNSTSLSPAALAYIDTLSSWLQRNDSAPLAEIPDSLAFNDEYLSFANDSTTGVAGDAYSTPPPEAPFAGLNKTNSVCLTYTGFNLCLPNGTFPKENSRFSWSLQKVTNIDGPAGATVRFNYRPAFNHPGYVQYGNRKSDSYPVGTVASDKLKGTMLSLFSDPQGDFDVIMPSNTNTPAACLFSNTNLKGNIACFGVGGGPLTRDAADGLTNVRDFAKSVSISGNATAWLFAQTYGDSSERRITAGLNDLHDLVLGTDSGFDGKIGALAVQAPGVV